MRNLFFMSLVLLSGVPSTGDQVFVDPTGTYILKGETRNNTIVGNSGELRARLLDSQTVAISLYLNKGYPGYESGALMDTLHYEDNKVVYTPGTDSSCSIYFAFGRKSVEIFQTLTDPHSDCGFRPGVLKAAVYEKISSDIPVIQDLSGHGVL
jgi:hypothetical protein